VSPTLLAHSTDAGLDAGHTWQARPLASVSPLLSGDALFVTARQEGPVHPTAGEGALGSTVEGATELLGLWRSETAGAQCW